METKTHFVVTFVSLILLAFIVVKPDGLIRKENTKCGIGMGSLDCQQQFQNFKVSRIDNKISELGID